MLLWVADTTSMLIAEPGPKLLQLGTELLLNPHSDHEVLVRPGLGQLPRRDSSCSSGRNFDDVNYASFVEPCLLRVALGTAGRRAQLPVVYGTVSSANRAEDFAQGCLQGLALEVLRPTLSNCNTTPSRQDRGGLPSPTAPPCGSSRTREALASAAVREQRCPSST